MPPVRELPKLNEDLDETNLQKHINKIKLKPTSTHVVQVDDSKLDEFARANMTDRVLAQRQDLAEGISELLVSAALAAGSNENITVNCILLPSSIVS